MPEGTAIVRLAGFDADCLEERSRGDMMRMGDEGDRHPGTDGFVRCASWPARNPKTKAPARASAKARQMASVRTRDRPTIQYSGIAYSGLLLPVGSCHGAERPCRRSNMALCSTSWGIWLKHLLLLLSSCFAAQAATVFI